MEQHVEYQARYGCAEHRAGDQGGGADQQRFIKQRERVFPGGVQFRYHFGKRAAANAAGGKRNAFPISAQVE